jgi:GT2 family glycosyltransferase
MHATNEPRLPSIGVVIATVDRPEDVARAVGSTLASVRERFEVVVVDQSGGEAIERALGRHAGDRRLRRLVRHRNGLSAALNYGIASVDAELIAITGDDCLAETAWLERLTEAFGRDERVAVVFGRVRPAPYDAALGFVPGCVIDEDFLASAAGDVHRMTGTTACMGVRKSVWGVLGGFDEALGVGAPLGSAEDLDLALRAVLAGHTVLQTPTVEVEHQTPVPWVERESIIRRNWYGTGAAMAKSLKLAGLPMTAGLVRLLGHWIAGRSAVAATYGGRPHRLGMLVGFVTGFARGLAMPVDRRTGKFSQ